VLSVRRLSIVGATSMEFFNETPATLSVSIEIIPRSRDIPDSELPSGLMITIGASISISTCRFLCLERTTFARATICFLVTEPKFETVFFQAGCCCCIGREVEEGDEDGVGGKKALNPRGIVDVCATTKRRHFRLDTIE